MKFPKSEPYQRSSRRAVLQAWFIAATAVAGVGLPSAHGTERNRAAQIQEADQALARDAQATAACWIDALQSADQGDALSLMRLPSTAANQQTVQEELDVMMDLLTQQGVTAAPIAHRRNGHWALSVWELNSLGMSLAPVIEPIALYHPAADGLFEARAQWQVVPHGLASDPALKPLYNADYDALAQWFETIV